MINKIPYLKVKMKIYKIHNKKKHYNRYFQKKKGNQRRNFQISQKKRKFKKQKKNLYNIENI